MNEQIASWFEGLIPEIKKTGDPRGTIIKFAEEKNLAPALMERLGYIYNTAKTVNYLDKSAAADRGQSFAILDVEDMVKEYTSKKANTDHKYADSGFSSFKKNHRVPKDLFMNVAGFDVQLDKPEDYEEVKLSSFRKAANLKSSINEANDQKVEELLFNLREDLRGNIEKFASDYSSVSNETDFKKIDQDAWYYFEGTAKEACDLLADYFKNKKGPSVKRASDKGKRRLIKDYSFLNQVGQIQEQLNNIKIASKDEFKQGVALELTSDEKAAQKKNLEKVASPPPNTLTLTDDLRQQILDVLQQGGNPADLLQGGGAANPGTLSKLIEATGKGKPSTSGVDPEKIIKGVEGLGSDILEGGKNLINIVRPKEKTRQKEHDIAMEDVEHISVLQNLLTTDEILADADPERVIEAFNTVRDLAPELAKDTNIMRVQLRAMIQHDGMSVFDANQLSKSELDKRKTDLQIRALDDHLHKVDSDDQPKHTLSR